MAINVYGFCDNNPIVFNDPLGDYKDPGTVERYLDQNGDIRHIPSVFQDVDGLTADIQGLEWLVTLQKCCFDKRQILNMQKSFKTKTNRSNFQTC